MSDNVEKETAGTKVNSFLERNKKIILIVCIAIVVLLVCYIVGYAVGKSMKNKNLSTIDEITFTLVDDSMSADEADLTARRNKALQDLQPLVTKGGIVGARANMLCADLSYQLENKEEAASYWMATAAKAKKTYIEPIAYYNIAVCYEDLGKMDEAAANYKIAADNENFMLQSHAKFSYGRCLESQGKYDEAVVVYNDLVDNFNSDSWADVAKSRILALQLAGKAE